MNGTSFDVASLRPDASPAAVTIGLVNNMPPAAFAATERQFRQLLGEAANGQDITVHCYRTGGYDEEAIFETELDGLIVTGAEPLASDLREEPIWPLVTRLVAWAEEQARPTLLSCLAAHAAVLHLDGVGRVRRDRKISGLFKGEVVAADHPLMAGLANKWTVPHSRFNDLPEKALIASGYRILVRSPEAGVDLFQRASSPNLLFLQSHPEYDADTLRREFHRDVKRFHAGERSEPPVLPRSYFGSIAGSLLSPPGDWAYVCRENADEILGWLSRCGDRSARAPWRPTAVTFFRNWLREVATAKARRGAGNMQFPDHAVFDHDPRHPGLVPC